MAKDIHAGHGGTTGGAHNRRKSNGGGTESDSSDDADVDEEDKEGSDEDESGDADEGAAKETNTSANVTPNATHIGNFGINRRIGQVREPRKAPVNCKMNKKSRFPMIVKPDCMS